MHVLVTGFKAYSFDDEKTGRRIAGTTMHYLEADQAVSDGQVGVVPCKFTVPENLRGQLVKAPAIYNVEFSTRPGAGGRPQVVLSKLEYVKDVKLGG